MEDLPRDERAHHAAETEPGVNTSSQIWQQCPRLQGQVQTWPPLPSNHCDGSVVIPSSQGPTCDSGFLHPGPMFTEEDAMDVDSVQELNSATIRKILELLDSLNPCPLPGDPCEYNMSRHLDLPSNDHSLDLPSQDHSLDLPSQDHSLDMPSQDHSLDLQSQDHSLDLPSQDHCLDLPSQDHSLDLPSQDHYASPTLGYDEAPENDVQDYEMLINSVFQNSPVKGSDVSERIPIPDWSYTTSDRSDVTSPSDSQASDDSSSLNPGSSPGYSGVSDEEMRAHLATTTPILYKFMAEILQRPRIYGRWVEWIDEGRRIFKFTDSGRVAKLWGIRKNRPKMNYENLSRSIRQYYRKGIMKKPKHAEKLAFQFCS